MIRIAASDLKGLIIKSLKLHTHIEYDDGNPFFIKIEEEKYFFFIKNISPAYFKHNTDITRVQVPSSKHFLNLNDNVPIIVLGYDELTDTIVVWDPRKIKTRLNVKANVSLYSRQSLQNSVNYNDVNTGYLSNNDKILLSKRKNILTLIKSMRTVFEITTVQNKFDQNSKNKNLEIENAISSLGESFSYLIESNQNLNAIQLLITELELRNVNFSLKECADYLKLYYFKN